MLFMLSPLPALAVRFTLGGSAMLNVLLPVLGGGAIPNEFVVLEGGGAMLNPE